jgi:hypothetical protein
LFQISHEAISTPQFESKPALEGDRNSGGAQASDDLHDEVTSAMLSV